MKPEPNMLRCDDAEAMRLWRECGLPEYFLGNGGANHKLVAFAEACRRAPAPSSDDIRRQALEDAARLADALGKEPHYDVYVSWRACLEIAKRIRALSPPLVNDPSAVAAVRARFGDEA